MRKMSLQWRITILTTLFIAIICGCLTLFVYKNGVYYIDLLQDTVDAKSDQGNGKEQDEIYINIPDDKWNDFADDFSIQVYNNKADYKKSSLMFSTLLALLGGVVTYFIVGHALKPLRKIADKMEEVQAQNLSDSRLEENEVKELNQISVSYNKMLERLSEAFDVQRQFTANAAHELRTPLSLMQVQLDLYHSTQHKHNDECTEQTITMVMEQNEKLSKMIKTLLDMSELQSVERDDIIMVDALVEEVIADLEPLAIEKNIRLIGNCRNANMQGSDILIYRVVYNLVENAIKYNHSGGQVTVTSYQKDKNVYLSVEDTGSGIPRELKERVFEPFFRVDKSRSRELGGVGLGLALVHEIVRAHDGSITVKDNPSGGTIFEVVLPQHLQPLFGK
ncbi:sensor histidine kinase [Blautia sp. 1033sp1_1033st1_G9_1033SCRN_220408]|uniref:sensor histidine kinase n=1 Tax=Blautia sp. 1033sp1_1033st1_G9_1033SCRN_220408 TaxID=3144490 RepID=UPI0034A3528E